MNEKTPVSFAEAFRVWAKIGILSFGGPAGQIALMHRILVDEKKWLSEPQFLHALNFCMLLPGPEAQQLATYSGWLLHGVKGGLAAGLMFILPGVAVMLGLSILYAAYAELAFVEAIFFGCELCVTDIFKLKPCIPLVWFVFIDYEAKLTDSIQLLGYPVVYLTVEFGP